MADVATRRSSIRRAPALVLTTPRRHKWMERLEARLLYAAANEMRQGVINRLQLPIDAYVDTLGTTQPLEDGSVLLQAEIMFDSDSGGHQPAEPAVLKFKRGGDLDPLFGVGGIVRGAFGSDQILVEDDGTLFIAGPSWSADPTPGYRPTITHLLPDGRFDADWGAGGVLVLETADDALRSYPSMRLTDAADGGLSVVVSTSVEMDSAVLSTRISRLQLGPRGETTARSIRRIDVPHYGGPGVTRGISQHQWAAGLFDDGRVLVLSTNQDTKTSAVAIMNADGQLDTSIGDEGWFAAPDEVSGAWATHANGSAELDDQFGNVRWTFDPNRGVVPPPARPAQPSPVDPEPVVDAYSDDSGIQFGCFNFFGGDRTAADGSIHSILMASGDVCDPILLIDSSVTGDGTTSTVQQWLFDPREPSATPSNIISGLDQRIVRREDGSLIAFFGSDGADDLYVLDTARLPSKQLVTVESLPTDTQADVDPTAVDELTIPTSPPTIRTSIYDIARAQPVPARPRSIAAALFAVRYEVEDESRRPTRQDTEIVS